MTGGPAHPGRRRFLTEFLRERVVEPAAAAHDAVIKDIRRERFEKVYESELRAFGPEVLADVARRTGAAGEGADYAGIAKALAEDMVDADDEPV